MSYEQKSTLVVEALSRWIEQFKNKPKLANLTRIFSEQLQALEDSNAEILTVKDKSVATDQQLDDIGALVGEPRSGRDDSDYLDAIDLRILINGSDGSIDDLNEIIAGFDGVLSFTITESFPAGLEIDILVAVVPPYDINPLASLVKTSRAGGIGTRINFFFTPSFQYDTAGGEYDVGLYAGSVAA